MLALISSFDSLKLLRVLTLDPGWDASPSQGYRLSLNLLVPIYMYTWVKRGTVRVKCLAQQHNSMPLCQPGIETRPLDEVTTPFCESTEMESTISFIYLCFSIVS